VDEGDDGAHAPRGEGYAAGPVFGVRVAGVPVECVRELRFTRTWGRVDEVLRLSGALLAEGAELADALHDVIGSAGPERKPALVGLRRDLFAGRRPTARVLSPEVMGALPESLARRITGWLGDHDRMTAARAELAGTLTAELAEKTEALREATRRIELRQGLAQSSPILSERLDRWLEEGRPPGRQTTLRLARYLARAAMKTSPYATFTACGLGRWGPAGSAARFAGDLATVGVAEVDRSLVHACWHASLRRPGPRDGAEPRVNPTAVEEDGRVWFLGPPPAEPIRSVPASEPLRAVLAIIRSWPGATHRSIAAWLAGGRMTAAAADRLLTTLVDIGLVERRPPFHDQSADPLAGLVGWLEGVEADDAGDLIEPLRAIGRAAAAYPAGAGEDGRRWRADVDRLAVETASRLGEPGGVLASARLIHESHVFPGPVVTLPGASLRRVHDDLDRIRPLLGLLDPSLPLKVAAADFFLRAYGPGASVPFLSFYRRVHDMGPLADTPAGRAVRRFLPREPRRGHGDGRDYGDRVARLRELRRTAWEELFAAQEEAGEGGAVPVRLLRGLAESWPRFVRPPEALSVYGQLTGGPEGPRLVLNGVSSGPGRGVGRIRHLLGVAGIGPGGEPVVRGTALAEFRTDHRSNLNLRPRALRVIDYPFSRGDAGPAPSPAGLRVEYDGERGLLALRDPGGAVIRPVHRGLTSEMYLPPAQSFLVRVFGANPTALLPGWALRGGLSLPPVAAVDHSPRLTIGTVVLMRARWRMRGGCLPVPGKGEDQGAYLVRLAGWLRDQGIPREFFARVMDVRGDPGGVFGKSRKPVYVDVTNWFLLQDLVRAIGDPDRLVVLEEALPGVPDAPRYGDRGARVTEYIFDLLAEEGG
jgi:hypothetical protein